MFVLTSSATFVAFPPGGAEAGSAIFFILNGALIVAATGILVWLWTWLRSQDLVAANTRVRNFLLSSTILFVLALGAIFNVSTAAYLGYEVPRDIMQDIQSAKLLWAGQPAFPRDMTEQIKETLDQEPPPVSLAKWVPGLAVIEREGYQYLVKEPWTQAHPAGMTLLLASLVPWLHVRSIMLLFSLMSVASLLGTVWLLRSELRIPDDSRLWLAFTLALLGWFPFWIVVRTGQVSFLLAFLMTLAWSFLRRERSVAAGICLGVATALKLFPGFLIVYLLLRRRKAFWPAALTAGTLLVGSFGLVGWRNSLDYFRVVNFVQEYYRGYKANLSMLSVFSGLAPSLDARWHFAIMLSRVFLVAVLGFLAWSVTRKSRTVAGMPTLDIEYAMFMVLLPVLSPVSWDHYMVVLALPLAVVISCLRTGSVFSENPWRVAGFVLTAAILAVPEHFAAWIARMVYPAMLLFKLPVVAVFGVFFLLWGLRMQLAQPSREIPFKKHSDEGIPERPVAA